MQSKKEHGEKQILLLPDFFVDIPGKICAMLYPAAYCVIIIGLSFTMTVCSAWDTIPPFASFST